MKPHRLDRTLGWRAGLAAGLALGGLMAAPSTSDAIATRTVIADGAYDAAVKGAPNGAGAGATSRFIVRSNDDQALAVGRAAVDLGGRLVARQASLGTMVVDLPAGAANRLRSVAGVELVTPDSKLRLLSLGDPHESTLSGLEAVVAGPPSNLAKLTGATTFWRNGYSGQGIDVALLDSGVLPVEGMMTTNKLVIGPDLSFESQSPNLADLDTFGHGTHMAGIIAGRDSGSTPSTYATEDTRFLGMAPGSRIVSLKLADAQGNTDVSQVIAAIDWVVAHAQDSGLNIRVMNLSFGTDSLQDYRLDPLAHAAEVAWNRGIVVVAAAGNGGGTRIGLANPAYDPALLAVGAVNTQGTSDRTDDVIPAFSQRGAVAEGKRAPDVVAPGTSVVGLRARGSFVDAKFGATGVYRDRFFKGSGTSQSAAVVSGAAALLLSQRPTLTPDQVKDILRRSAYVLPGVSVDAQGAGSLDLAVAYYLGRNNVAAAKVHAGGGSLDQARGRFKVKKNGVVLTGELDIFGEPVATGVDTAPTPGTDILTDTAWADGYWTGPPLLGATWAGDKWTGATWAGATWAGATWAGATWAGATWAGATWAGNSWAGATWAGATWADAQWANDLWSSAGWE